MAHIVGSPDVRIGLIDGPVLGEHPHLQDARLRPIRSRAAATCTIAASSACLHGTFIAGMLVARSGSGAPAICPGCTLLVRPIFAEADSSRDHMPSATPLHLAAAIVDCIGAGAQIINLSLGLARPSCAEDRALEHALHYALKRNVLVIAAAGNQGTLGSSAITRHPWVIPVMACGLDGRPIQESNLGNSIGRRGLRAPGDNIASLGTDDRARTLSGTSVAVPFVTGAAALLWSEFPSATAAEVKLAITQAGKPRQTAIVPPLLDATAAYQALSGSKLRRKAA